MSLDLGYEEEQEALAESVRRFCERQCTDEVVRAIGVPEELWRGLADLGVLALGSPEGGGGALEIAAAMEELGAAACPGPLVPTFMAVQLLDEEERISLGKGETMAALGAGDLFAWGPVAAHFVEVTGEGAWRVRPTGDVEAVDTLGNEPWGRVDVERIQPLGAHERAIQVGDVAVAAYLVGAGRRLLRDAAAYAVDRIQFGKAIAEFQAVSHPLADSHLRLTAAGALTRIAAYEVDHDDDRAVTSTALSRLSATRAALDAALRVHQTYGAMGYTVEGPVGHVSTRLRQISLLAPGPDHARARVRDRRESVQPHIEQPATGRNRRVGG